METKQIAFRFPVDLLERLDRHVERMRVSAPGFLPTRADAVRSLLLKGLDEAEREEKGSTKS